MSTCPSTGTFYKQYSGQGNVFKSPPEEVGSRVKCFAACLKSQPRCIGINYDEEKSCELLDRVLPGSSAKERSKQTWIAGNLQFVFIDINIIMDSQMT